jgi:hypothetical protein
MILQTGGKRLFSAERRRKGANCGEEEKVRAD